MNQTKRKLEKIAAIYSIVLGSIMTLLFLLTFSIFNNSELLNEALAEAGYHYTQAEIELAMQSLKTVIIFVIILSIAIIVIGALLTKSPIKYGVVRNRLGLQIALAVLLGISTLMILDSSIIVIILFVAPLVLIIISMCLKHPVIVETTTESVTATIDNPRE